MIVLAALEGHDIKHLPLVYRLSRWLWRILSWVMGMERMRLEYNGRVPGGTAGSVGVELAGSLLVSVRVVLARVGGR